MDRVRLYIKGLSYSQTQSGAYALVLGEEDGERRLPIIIGGFEAQSIAIALEKGVNPPRPLTHDLFKNALETFEIELKEVIINNLLDNALKYSPDQSMIDISTHSFSNPVCYSLKHRKHTIYPIV